MTQPTDPVSPQEPSTPPPLPPQEPPAPAAESASPVAQYAAPGDEPVFEKADIEQNKVFALLAYIGLLFLVPLLAAPKSPFARYHTNQGLILFLFSAGIGVVVTILSFIGMFIPFINILVGIVSCLVYAALMVGTFVLMIMGIINAANGVAKPLPLIGKMFTLIK